MKSRNKKRLGLTSGIEESLGMKCGVKGKKLNPEIVTACSALHYLVRLILSPTFVGFNMIMIVILN